MNRWHDVYYWISIMKHKTSKLSELIKPSHIILIVCGLAALSLAQYRPPYDFYGPHNSGVFGIADKHFQGILFPEVYKYMPSVKILYPGLWVPEVNSAAIGLLPGRLSNAGWDGVYGWADVNNNPGILGGWLGNFNLWNSYRIYEYNEMVYTWDLNDFSIRGAFWASPFRNDVFKGASLTVDIDNTYAYHEYEGVTDIMRVYVNINTLTKISDKYFMRAGLHTYNRHAEEPTDKHSDNRAVFNDGFYVGFVDKKLRALELRAENTFAINNFDEKSDTISVSLRYRQGWAYDYLKHNLFLGLKTEAGFVYPSRVNEDASSFQYFHYMQCMTREGRIFHANFTLPVILDAHLFNGLRGMLSVAPNIHYVHISPLLNVDHLPYTPAERKQYMNPQHTFVVGMPDITLSLGGPIGDKFEFMVVPTLSNDVFMAALEIRYRF
jgi:hypothetical protein